MAITFLSAFVAAFGLMGGDPLGVIWLVAVLVIGGVLAALVARPGRSTGGVIANLTLPVPIVAFFAIASVSSGDFGWPQTWLIALGLFTIFEIPIVATAGARAAVRSRSRAGAPTFAGPPMDEALAAATDYGRADTVVRVYPHTAWGRSEVRSDRHQLAEHGYLLVEIEEHAETPESIQRLGLLLELGGLGGLPGLEERAPSLVATFKRLDPSPATDAPTLPETSDAPRGRLRRGRRRHGPSSTG